MADPFADDKDPFADIPKDPFANVPMVGENLDLSNDPFADPEDPFADIKSNPYPGIIQNLKSRTALGRIWETIAIQAGESLKDYGVDPETRASIRQSTEEAFGPKYINVFGMKVFNPLQAAGEEIVSGLGEVGSVVMEGIPAVIETGLAGTGQALVEAGMDRGDVADGMRDAVMLLTMWMGQAGSMAPKPRVRPTVIDKPAEIVTKPTTASKKTRYDPGQTITEKDLQGLRAKMSDQLSKEELKEIDSAYARADVSGLDKTNISNRALVPIDRPIKVYRGSHSGEIDMGGHWTSTSPMRETGEWFAEPYGRQDSGVLMEIDVQPGVKALVPDSGIKGGEIVLGPDTIFEVTGRKQIRINNNPVEQITVVARPGQGVKRAQAETIREPELTIGEQVVGEIKQKMTPKQKEVLAKSIDEGLDTARLKIGKPEIIADFHAKDFARKVFSEYFDGLQPLKLALFKAGEKLGEQPDLTLHRDMRLLNGMKGIIQSIHEEGTPLVVRESGKVETYASPKTRAHMKIPDSEKIMVDAKAGDLVFGGKGFNDIIAPLEGKLDRWLEYGVGKRAKELLGQGREKLFTEKEINALLDVGEDAKLFESAWAEYQGFNDRILDFAVDLGYLSKEAKNAIREVNQDFFSFERAIEGTGSGGKTPFQKLKGGTANLNDLLENTMGNFSRIVEQTLINDAKARNLQYIERAGLDDVATRLPKEVTPELAAVDQSVVARLVEEGMTEQQARAIARPLTVVKTIGKDTETVMINGERVAYKINDPYFLKALQSVTPEAYPLAIRVLSGFKSLLTAGVTLSLEFMMKNTLRDTQMAFVQSGGNFIPMVSTIRGMRSRLMKNDDYYFNLLNGGGFSSLYKGDVMAARKVRARYRQAGIKPKNVLDSLEAVVDKLGELSGVFEESSRLGEFGIIRKKTQSLRESAAAARGVSTDFGIQPGNRKVKMYLATLPFTNARNQSLVRIGRQFKDEPVKTGVKGLLAITIPSLGLYAYNKDKPEYQALPDWVKDQHFVFVLDDGEVLLASKGFEAGAIFATVPERFFEAIEQEHGKRFADAMLRMFVDTFSQNPVPQAVRPVFEVSRNENFFGPIVPESLKDVEPHEQFRPDTSDTFVEMARWLSEDTGIEVSPIQAESLVRGYLGTLGTYLLDGSDYLVRLANGGDAPDKRIDELPVTKAFFRNEPLRKTSFEEDFYELLGESRMMSATLSKVISEGREPKIDENDPLTSDRFRKVIESVSRDIAAMNKTIRLIKNDNTLSGEEKREQIDEIIRAQNQIFQDFILALPEDFAKQHGFITE